MSFNSSNRSGSHSVCTLCGGLLQRVIVELPFFRHVDFNTIAQSSDIEICNTCNVVVNRALFSKSEEIFQTKQYAQSGQTSQLIDAKNQSEKIPKSRVQAQIISKLMTGSTPRILDIGCYDGKLLNELAKIYSKASLVGYDIAGHVLPDASNKSRIEYVSTDDHLFEQPFDVVIYSHSISYIRNIANQISQIFSSLSKNGCLFVQMPDITKNPYYALMGDQLYTFTPFALTQFLTIQGFNIATMNCREFPREYIVVANPIMKNTSKNVAKQDPLDYLEVLGFLERIKKSIKKKLNRGFYGVFGTTVSAAFVDSIAGPHIRYFVDEMRKTTDLEFRRKPIIHPQKLSSKDIVYFPNVAQGEELLERIASQYDFRTIQLESTPRF